MSIQPAKATNRHRNEVEQPQQGLCSAFVAVCYSGQVTTWRNHLIYRLHLQEALGSAFKLTQKNIQVRKDG